MQNSVVVLTLRYLARECVGAHVLSDLTLAWKGQKTMMHVQRTLSLRTPVLSILQPGHFTEMVPCAGKGLGLRLEAAEHR